MDNYLELEVPALSINESFLRTVVAAFLLELNPTLDEVDDVKTAVSEAVTNAIVHGYENDVSGKIKLRCNKNKGEFVVEVTDFGIGIPNVEKAMEPLYTTKASEERTGMGFSFMEAFMDEISVKSTVGKGTSVVMKKRINGYRE